MSYRIRPHHGMCIAYFRGNGYSPEFTEHMKEMIPVLKQNPDIELTFSLDDVCSACPNQRGDICVTQEKVLRYDNGVLNICQISEGTHMGAKDFLDLVETKILKTGLRKEICGDCSWNYICEAIEQNA